MTNAFGREVYVFNPYTYEELITHPGMERADLYLQCLSGKTDVSSGCDSLAPRIDALEEQHVTALAVVQRCRDNYYLEQWDAGAWLLYDDYSSQGVLQPAGASGAQGKQGGSAVGKCLLYMRSVGEVGTACMQDWLGAESKKAFRYDTVSEEEQAASSMNVAACKIFSGPAKSQDPEIAQVFKGCATGYEETECQLPKIAWSGGSKNRLPVANEHVVDATTVEERTARAKSDYQVRLPSCTWRLLRTQARVSPAHVGRHLVRLPAWRRSVVDLATTCRSRASCMSFRYCSCRTSSHLPSKFMARLARKASTRSR